MQELNDGRMEVAHQAHESAYFGARLSDTGRVSVFLVFFLNLRFILPRKKARLPMKCPLSSLASLTLAALAITGCGANLTTSPITGAKHSATGRAMGGQQPVSGASIALYAIGQDSDGDPTQSSLFDSVTTDQNGNFTFPPFTCPTPTTLVYVAGAGGNPGIATGSDNAGLSLVTALGQCGALNSNTYISVNELTTVAAAYALAPFLQAIRTQGTSVATGASLQDAFTYATELVNSSTGTVPGNVPAGTNVPVAQINTIADIIAACVNSAGGSAGDGTICGNLFTLTPNSQNVYPGDTVTALVNLAQNPTENTMGLFNLLPAQPPFGPTDSTQPADFSIHLTTANGFSAYPQALTYPAATIGFAQPTQVFSVNNVGSDPVSLGSYSFTGAGAADFLVTDTSCGSMLGANSSCTFTVSFTPSASGNRSGYFVLNNGSVNSTLSVAVSGTGNAPAASVAPLLTQGLISFGDSNTYGTGYMPSYPALLDTYFASGSTFENLGVPGYQCWNQTQSIFTTLSPQSTGNPVVTDMIGSNDLNQLSDGLNTPGAVYYAQCQWAGNAYAALPAANTIPASSAQATTAGTWSADTSYPNFPGLVSTTANSCVTVSANVPDGVFYLWYLKEYSSGGTLSVSTDGQVSTDTISSTSQLSSVIKIYINQTQESYPALARFVTAPGQHTISACVTSATGASNDVHIYGFGFPPATTNTAATAPLVLLGGVIYYEGDSTDSNHPGLATANSLNQQIAGQLAADNLNVQFVNVRNFVNATSDMQADGNCMASGQPGFHVNNCGTFALEEAFWEALNATQAPKQ